MSDTTSVVEIRTLLGALEVFNQAPDKEAIARANNWLQEFQHSLNAWMICKHLLETEEGIPPAARVFAAQTLRTKITYDLDQLDSPSLERLRETLLAALHRYHAGPKNIIIQLSLAISGYALQVAAWRNPVQTMIEAFGPNPATVPALLQFLAILPEEMYSNTRIPITDEDYRTRTGELLTDNAEKVVQLLSMYLTAEGVSIAIQSQVFNCLRSWLVSGEIAVQDLVNTSLLSYAFEALASDQLFDDAVEVICAIIHETQEVDDNTDAIQLIVPRVISLKAQLTQNEDDIDKFKGLARIFTEAGETYRILLIRLPEQFFPIIEAIGICSAHPDLDIVPITFPFWMRLAQVLGKKPSVPPLFIDAYTNLMKVIIRHLHFPPDSEALVGQEADNFRSFRHVMGDTLKDCCYVIGTETCLFAAYDMITAALARGSLVSWQEIEAPLFSLRSMGAEIDRSDDKAVPKIMDLIPSLPAHPRVRYAALLIVARYTEWISAHPQYVTVQLDYISQGFQDSDSDVNAAAGQALKYLCQDCKEHLTEVLPTLHTFIISAGGKLAQEDRKQVYEAIAHVISAMPMEQAALSLKTFAADLLALVHALAVKQQPASAQEVTDVCDALENLEVMLSVIKGYGEHLPAACQGSCEEAWAVFDSFLVKYGNNFEIADRVTRVLRHGISLFGPATRSIAATALKRLSVAFDHTGYSGYMWIAGKLIANFGVDKDQELHSAITDLYAASTLKVVSILQIKDAGHVPDVLEDYLHLLKQVLENTPDIYFEATTSTHALRIATVALNVIQTEVAWTALEHIRNILVHPCLEPTPTPPPSFPIFAAIINQGISAEGKQIVQNLVSGLAEEPPLPDDSTSMVITVFRSFAALWPRQLLEWLPAALELLPSAPSQARKQFFDEVNSSIGLGQVDKVKYAVLDFHRASRKARERRRAIRGE